MTAHKAGRRVGPEVMKERSSSSEGNFGGYRRRGFWGRSMVIAISKGVIRIRKDINVYVGAGKIIV